MDRKKIDQLREVIKNSNNIVFFGGAGVSTESGIPDFRSKDGLYNQKYKKNPEYMLSKTCFDTEPEEFWRFYRDKILIDNITPNKGHMALRKLEKMGKLKAIITQNIDSLHEDAGSETVYHIHGTIKTNHCPYCKREYSLEEIMKMPEVPGCDCGILGSGTIVIKPDIVLYEETLPDDEWRHSVAAVYEADTLIVAGTSLTVYPAVMLLDYFRGDNLVIINRDETDRDKFADIVIRDNIAGVLYAVIKDIQTT